MPPSQQQRTGPPLPPPPLPPGPSIFSGYRPQAAGAFDELVSPQGAFRSSYLKFVQLVDRLGPDEFSRRWQQAQRLIHENGIAYSPYGDPAASGRPWELDAMPLLMRASEWATIAAGVAQRAQVLQLTLQDLLGPQQLLREGLLPPSLLLDHPGFRLPFHGQLPSQDVFLQFYACDLGRSADGRWWLLADRTEAPSGIGFALENRVVVSRMLPEIFRQCNVQRLAPFFLTLRASLQARARIPRGHPRVVLLSRGPADLAYFEDAYLARYLGYALIEGEDLAVRDHRVWLKTLEGLLPVDVLLRRPNSELCDPLEFGDATSVGVAGLLHVARGGKVAIANPLGSGLVESPVFMAFMPRLCQFFLQEELRLPGLATWWCGHPQSLEYVLRNFDNIVVGPAFRQRGQSRDIRTSLSRLTRDELQARIKQHPEQYIAQERLDSSTAPVWKQSNLAPEKLVMRAFAVGHQGTFTVMDGGLARTSSYLDPIDGVVPAGQGSKDAWIVGNQPVEPVTLLASRDHNISLRRTGADLPSRVADNIFWLGRQIERADSAARLLRTVILQMTSETADGTTRALPHLLRRLAEQGQIEPGYVVEEIKQPLPNIETSLPQLTLDLGQAGSLRSVFDQLFRLASKVRDRLSVDTWRIFVRLDQRFRSPRLVLSADLTDILTLVNALIVDVAAIEGMVMESMTRSYVFRFLDLGRRLERALQTTCLIDSCFVGNQSVSAELFEAVLEIADSLMTYRSRYLANLQLAAVFDLLLTDETNPRSIAYQLLTMQQHIDQLPQDEQAEPQEHQQLILSLVQAIRTVDVQELSADQRVDENSQPLSTSPGRQLGAGTDGSAKQLWDVPLAALLQQLADDLPRLSNKISQRYLVHAGPARMLAAAPMMR